MKTELNLPTGPLRWLREKLTRIQSAKVLEAEAAQVGYTISRPLCGVKVQGWDYGTRDVTKINCAACLELIAKGVAFRMDEESKMEINDPSEWRLSQSGFSIKTGWADEKKIVAKYPGLTAPLDVKQFAEWMANAERICELYNATLKP